MAAANFQAETFQGSSLAKAPASDLLSLCTNTY